MITEAQKEKILNANAEFRLRVLDAVGNPVLRRVSPTGAAFFSLPDSVNVLKEDFTVLHAELVKTQKSRFRAEDELSMMLSSKKAPPADKLLKKQKEVEALRTEWRDRMEAFLDARRWEEFSRCLPEAYRSGEPSDVVDVARFAILTAAWSPSVKEIVEAAEKIESLLAE